MRKKHKFLKKNIGFTLTELIVTLAVSALLLSASVAGIVAWVHHADFVRNESYAETIYYAVQNELTRYRGNGQLAELAEYVTKNDLKVPIEHINPEIGEAYKNRLYYLKKDAGPVDENNPLGEWLSDYIYDDSIIEGAICVEFDPMDGTVYSVSYSDSNDSFTYAKEPDDTEKKEASLLKRAENIRRKARVGYYSVELSEAAPSAVRKTRLDRVELVNREQLYLRWSLPQRYSGIRGFLSYTIEIYEKAGDTLKYTFTIKGSDLKEKGSGDSITGNISEYTVTCTDASEGEFEFIAYMDENGEMYLVLDSIDYGVHPDKIESVTVPGEPDPSFNTDAFRNSASVLQLFAEPEDIYVKIQASGKLYKASAKKRSNTSNTMFASMNERDESCIYEIKNARHLYNIRYREKEKDFEASIKPLYYRQTADIVWSPDTEKLFHSVAAVGESGMKMGRLQGTDKHYPSADGTEGSVPYFPAIPSLMSKSTLAVWDSRAYELVDFVLCKDGGTSGNVGIIAENRGTIQGLTLINVNVHGLVNVGAVCGVNKVGGKIRSTTVSGKVAGTENVGGLVGLDETNSVIPDGTDRTNLSPDELEASSYKNLINYAEVTGTEGKIGGIVGTLGENGQAYLCENYGAVKGTETCTVYIGGISGYSKGLVQNCISAPDDEPAKNDNGKYELKGIFVGGIVGCNNGGVVKDSGTEKESKTLAGKRGDAHIIGYRYVGGIVGYNNGIPDGTEDRDTTGTLVNTDAGKTNKATVVGHEYVGGIVGANGRLTKRELIDKDIKSLTPEEKAELETCEIEDVYSDLMLVEGWTNEGLFEAIASVDSKGNYSDGSYAGGIAGCNTGDLLNCTTRINTVSGGSQGLTEQVRGADASYVGGIVGYNEGYISGTETISVNSVAAGKKYVGGIVGYNRTAARISSSVPDDKKGNSGKIKNYELSGGYIFGEAYVGGYAGLNTTENLLGEILCANPNEVEADYFAGGVMGALILVPENDTKITAKCKTENLFGNITANKAFAGGYVGYTQLLEPGENAEERPDELYKKVAGESIQQLAANVLDERITENSKYRDHATCKLELPSGESSFQSVKAPIFAGGVIGGNSWNTNLLLQNITNKTRVTGTSSVTYDFISETKNTKEGPEEKQDTFSFAGGVIGLVTPKMIIHDCRNENAGGVDAKGTYSGGIAEVNLGTIRHCTVAGDAGKNYYGGIAGLNTNEGRIENCNLDGQISGESYLGGIAVCNESIITGCTVASKTDGESAVIGTGEYIGGIAAVSRRKELTVNGGKTYYPNEMAGCHVMSNIGAENQGTAVGGLIGKYMGGTLKNCDVWDNTICGFDRVGGIAGEIYTGLEAVVEGDKKVSNMAEIIAAKAAGGVGGYLHPGASLKRCQNAGNVRSTGGLAGGIVPEIGAGSEVSECDNYGGVEATKMTAGGIAAKNNGTIKDCVMSSSQAGESAFIIGVDAIGGIAGENRGEILSCKVKGSVTVRDINASGKGRKIGGVAGLNTGFISDSMAEGMPQVVTLSNDSYLGGIAGTNVTDAAVAGAGIASGTIQGGTANLTVSLNEGQSGAIGGIAGANAGTIKDITFTGTVTGTAGRRYGTGGIAGRNELANKAGVISGCKLSGATVRAVSNASGFGGYKDTALGVYVGGICGVNPERGTVTGCYLEGTSTVSGDYGYVGGIAAYNFGELTNSGCKKVVDIINNNGITGINEDSAAGTEGTVISNSTSNNESLCVMGGIVGYNDASGVLENCSTGRWTVTNNRIGESEVCPTGGIIGCNKSIRDQQKLVNCAEVKGGWMTGGIIGEQTTEQRDGFTIEKCKNYGNITATIRSAGGIISDWRNKGGKVRECTNYGVVSVETGELVASGSYHDERNSAGGIIGTGYLGSGTLSITIERCGNEGNIFHRTKSGVRCGRAAGIFGCYNAAVSTLDLTITDCYNAALIQNESDVNDGLNIVSAGIFAGDATGDAQGGAVNLTIARCVNYGRGTDKTKRFAGIVSKNRSNNGTKRVEQCLNVGECYADQKPIAYNMLNHDVAGGKDNYYFSNPTEVDFGYNSPARGRQAAVLQTDNTFKAVDDDKASGKSIYFDKENNRLYLDGTKYLQFTKVLEQYPKSGEGSASDIKRLKEAFSPDDEEYILLLYGMNSGSFNKPNQVKLEKLGDSYKVTYEPDAYAIFCTAGYEVEILGRKENGEFEKIFPQSGAAEINGHDQNTWTIRADELFKTVKKADYTDLKARVRAKKADGYDSITTTGNSGYSDWAESDLLSTKPKLPTPQIHFEVIKNGGENNISGYFVLSNAEDYADYGKDWEIVLDGRDTNGSNLGDVGVLSADKPRTKELSYTRNVGVKNAFNVTVNAHAEPMPQNDDYSRSDEVSKMISWYPKNRTLKAELVDANEKGEFIGTKAGELSYRFRLRQSETNYEYCNITCNAEFWFDGKLISENTVLLPQMRGEAYCTIDLSNIDQDTVREIMENLNKAESDPGRKEVEVCFYPWEIDDCRYYVTDDATKTVKTKTIPEAYKNNQSAFDSSYKSYTLNGMTEYQMLPAPEPGDNAIIETADDGTITYTLYWDATVGNNNKITANNGDNYKNAKYTVTVTGKSDDGTEVMLDQRTVNVDDKTPPAVTLTENNWKYNKLVLNVERLGDASGSTRYIGASTEKEYQIPIRLSSTVKPSAKLRDRDDLVFVVEWVKSVEEGANGYRIIMTGTGQGGNSFRETVDVGKDVAETEIDLDKYPALNGANQVNFSVVVLSDPKTSDYLNSRESSKVQCAIPARLPEPSKMPELKLPDKTAVDKNKTLTAEEFASLILHVEDSAASSENATYRIEYFVADENAKVLADWSMNDGERPEADSENGIYISGEPEEMNGNLRSADYVLNKSDSPFNAEQAGRILWYRVREVSPNKISSVWTGWQKIELPKVLLEPVEIPESQTADRECVYTIDGVGKEDYIITMRQPKLGFAPVPFAKGYAIDIKEANSTAYEEYVDEIDGSTKMREKTIPGALHSYTLEKITSPEGEPLVESLVLKEGDNKIKVESEETSESGETIWSFAPLYTIDHSYKIQSSGSEKVYTITTSARLCYSAKDGIIQEIWLELPDGEALDKDGNPVSDNSFIGTATADITVTAPDPDRYVVEQLTRWQRDETDNETITITTVEMADGLNDAIAVAGYFEDELNAKQLSNQVLRLFGLSSVPEKLLPEKEELSEEEDEKKTDSETDAEKSDASGNDVLMDRVSGNNVPDSDEEEQ